MPLKDPLKAKEYRQEYYRKNKEKILERMSTRYTEKADEIKAYTKQRYQEKHDEILLQMKDYREKNKEKVLEGTQRWLATPENKAKVKEYKKEWGKNWLVGHKADKNAQTAKRYAQKKLATTEDADLALIKEFYKLSHFLSEKTGIKYSVDHIKPIVKGGLHHQDNLQVITLEENIIKRDKYPYNVEKAYFPTKKG